MKIVKRLIKIFLICVIGYLAVPLFFSVTYQLVGYFTLDTPDVPVIRNGEFPFEVTYEKNGECITIKDVYVCEYDGIDITLGGKFLSWEGHFKSGNENILTIYKDDKTEIVLNIGSYWYYMGDPRWVPIDDGEQTPTVYKRVKEGSLIYSSSMSDDELYSEYGIKIIDWKLSDPIENTYVPKKWYEFWK